MLNIIVSDRGTWVINKQSPNQQIWWSSPIRYPFFSYGTRFFLFFCSQCSGTYIVARIWCLGRAAGAVATRTKLPCPLRWWYIYCQYVYKYSAATVRLGLRMARIRNCGVSTVDLSKCSPLQSLNKQRLHKETNRTGAVTWTTFISVKYRGGNIRGTYTLATKR